MIQQLIMIKENDLGLDGHDIFILHAQQLPTRNVKLSIKHRAFPLLYGEPSLSASNSLCEDNIFILSKHVIMSTLNCPVMDIAK